MEKYRKLFSSEIKKYRLRVYQDLIIFLSWFIRYHFLLDRLIFYENIDNLKWQAIHARCEEGFTPPHATLDTVWRNKSPYFLQVGKLVEKCRSESLKKWDIKTSFAVPFYEDPFLVLYGDSSKEELTKEEKALFDYWIVHIHNNEVKGSDWFIGVPYTWWHGYSKERFIQELPNHLNPEKEPLWTSIIESKIGSITPTVASGLNALSRWFLDTT